jgi:putative acetyltransferase
MMRGAADFRVVVRAARAADAPALAAIHARAIGALAAAHYTDAERAAWIARISVERLREAMTTRRLRVAEAAAPDGSRVVGYAQLHPGEGAVEAIYVDPDWARRGVGRALLGALEADARALGLPGLVLEASLNSVPFYVAMGFRQRGLDRHELAPGVQMVFAVMEKRFAPPAPSGR